MSFKSHFLRKASGSTDLERTQYKVTQTLATGKIPSLVVGGFAVQEHGYARFTEDIDILVPDVSAAIEWLSIRGFKLNPGSSMTMTDRETKVEVDILPAGGRVGPGPLSLPDPSQLVLGTAVAPLRQLLEMKLSAYIGNGIQRIQDLADVTKLILINHLPKDFPMASEVQELYQSTWDQLHA